MPNVFISYRRSDSQEEANAIFEFLSRAFGRENVFLDRESLPAGEHFPSYLRERIYWADVILLLIGPDWQGARHKDGRFRIEQQHDYVRLEVELALFRFTHQNIPVIPIIINGLSISRIGLPFGLEGIRELSGFEITNDNYQSKLDLLKKRLDNLSSNNISSPQVQIISYSHLDVNEFNHNYGGLAKQVPRDADIFLENDNGYWKVEIKCRSIPSYNRSWLQLNTESIRHKSVEEAVGAMMEWYAVNPEQCVIWREGPSRRSVFGLKKSRREDGEWRSGVYQSAADASIVC